MESRNNKNRIISSPLFDEINQYFQDSSKSRIFIFVPFIKTKILEKLISDIASEIIIITTWNPQNILDRSSELELYPFCKENKITLYLNNKIHLKVYSRNLESAIIASGNISQKGLMPNGNYEVGTFIEKLSSRDRLYFEKIKNEAILVDVNMYEQLKNWKEEQNYEKANIVKFEEIVTIAERDNFLISALPMTKEIDELIEGYEKITLGLEPSDDFETSACIFHDLANYNIEPGLSKEEFLKKLKIQFFAHPFIQKINEFIAPEAYFGRIKEWIQDNCTDVPVPSRRELTGNVQVLYEWFEHLGEEEYVIDIPGAYSQRITNVKL